MLTVQEASPAQLRLLAMTPKVTGSLSFLSSLYIIHDIVRVRRSQRQKIRPYHHILLGMSVCDSLSSLGFFLSTWPIPPDILPIWGAVGTQQTCTLQGFLIQFSITAVYYNFFLALNYFLSINRRWSEVKIRKVRLVAWANGISLSLGIGVAVLATSLGLMNPIGAFCWINTVPLSCQESWQRSGNGLPCIRGDNATLFQWIFFRIPLVLVVAFVSYFMFAVYLAYKKQIEAAQRWNFDSHRSNSSRDVEQRSLVVSQSLLYTGSFFIVWIPGFIFGIHALTTDETSYYIYLAAGTFSPLQGFLNVIVYLRPKWVAWKRNRPVQSGLSESSTPPHQGQSGEKIGEGTGKDRALAFQDSKKPDRAQDNSEDDALSNEIKTQSGRESREEESDGV